MDELMDGGEWWDSILGIHLFLEALLLPCFVPLAALPNKIKCRIFIFRCTLLDFNRRPSSLVLLRHR